MKSLIAVSVTVGGNLGTSAEREGSRKRNFEPLFNSNWSLQKRDADETFSVSLVDEMFEIEICSEPLMYFEYFQIKIIYSTLGLFQLIWSLRFPLRWGETISWTFLQGAPSGVVPAFLTNQNIVFVTSNSTSLSLQPPF